jgi:hypothetical protein
MFAVSSPGRTDLDDTIRRLQAYEKAGADVLFPPGLRSLDDTRTAVCQSVGKPVNIVIGPPDCRHSIADPAACGVKRVSLGGDPWRERPTPPPEPRQKNCSASRVAETEVLWTSAPNPNSPLKRPDPSTNAQCQT